MTALVWVGLALAGGVGAVLRHVVTQGVRRRTPASFPWGTLTVNLVGAFALGLLDGLAVPHDLALVVGTGLVGAYTTFSTWVLETRLLLAEHRPRAAAANLGVSLAAGLALAALGLWLGAALT